MRYALGLVGEVGPPHGDHHLGQEPAQALVHGAVEVLAGKGGWMVRRGATSRNAFDGDGCLHDGFSSSRTLFPFDEWNVRHPLRARC